MEHYDLLFKIVLIGESAVGKSSLILRYMDQQFLDTHLATIGVDFSIRTVDVEGKRVKLQIWDTAGQERFRALCRQFYRSAHAVVFVYDVTDPKSFQLMPLWLQDVKEVAPERARLFLVGNKTDLGTERVVLPFEGSEFAKAYDMTFFETSARRGTGVEELFTEVAQLLTREAKKSPADGGIRPPSIVGPSRPVKKDNFSCCAIM